ncbi:hypothetical protein [Deinococcus sp. SL84]|uniref:hypothetical protein n=1 Tax=Deinococcus sp. SL84 TaxID=2994663 RepID=UPI00227664FC|nr:hypothetical protein [Deinococcus sp. SL84]MCY1702861.1 hypothetical protein [Deinococcus sp. SL84]
MKKFALLMSVVALAATSCAPKYNAATQKPVATLSCTEIKTEFAQLQAIRAEAQSKSGLSKENVGLTLLFWPGAVLNELDNRDVIEKVDARTAELVKANTAKSCPALQ